MQNGVAHQLHEKFIRKKATMTLKFNLRKLPDELQKSPLISLCLLKENIQSGAETQWATVWRRGETIFTKYFFSSEESGDERGF